ncbi:uncharacterized protein LOC103874832 [Brassica rapa]|uniref:uncharacterized protein LOC103874832 n=1 Tax=Brassica campestris TaxID=3711 RepID=UPI00142D63F1|nr:uncharacterized protein LOC103874832 [Brassica rapa]
MWHIDNQSMFVAKWKPGLQPAIPELTSAQVWLDFHNVPPQFYSEEGLEHIAGALGDPLFLHPATSNMTNLEVARVFTIIDPTRPLPEAVNVRFESGHTERIEVSSPWLPPTCEHCKEVGHSIKNCLTAPITCLTCQSSGHKQEQCPKGKNTEAPTGGKVKKKKKKSKTRVSKAAEETILTETVEEGNLVIDIGLDKIPQEEPPREEPTVETEGNVTPAGVQGSDSDSKISTDSEPEGSSSAEENTDESGSEEDNEVSDSSSSDESSFSTVTSKRTKKQQRKKERQAALKLQLQREKELKRSTSSKTRNL